MADRANDAYDPNCVCDTIHKLGDPRCWTGTDAAQQYADQIPVDAHPFIKATTDEF